MFTERQSKYDDIFYLSENLRNEDIDELALLGFTPEKALKQSYFNSEYCFTVICDKKPVAMFGARRRNFTNNCKRASIWLLGTKNIEKNKTEFLRKSKKYIEFFKSKFDILENYIDVNNKKYIKWLKWLGFNFGRPFKYKNGQFIYFYL